MACQCSGSHVGEICYVAQTGHDRREIHLHWRPQVQTCVLCGWCANPLTQNPPKMPGAWHSRCWAALLADAQRLTCWVDLAANDVAPGFLMANQRATVRLEIGCQRSFSGLHTISSSFTSPDSSCVKVIPDVGTRTPSSQDCLFASAVLLDASRTWAHTAAFLIPRQTRCSKKHYSTRCAFF